MMSEVRHTIQKAPAPRPNRARSGHTWQCMQSRSKVSSAVFIQELATVRLHLREAIPERFEFSNRFPRCDAPCRVAPPLDYGGSGASVPAQGPSLSHTFIVG